MVIAGPGTGKTHILTTRIGQILMETDTQPNNILCLTFTDAGVHAMRQRLLQIIGPEAHRVHIFTFHAFCNKIIQDNMERFGRYGLEPLSDLERIELMRELLDSLPAGHLLRHRTNSPYFYERHLKDLFQKIKTEAWSPEFVLAHIDSYLEDLPNRAEFIYQRKSGSNKKGDLKQWKIDETTEKMNRLRAGVLLYPRYIQMMEKAGRYDFDDMILWVLREFKTNESLLRTYQEQYLYFLIDEYQDTNGSQYQIVQQLIDYWAKPNIFIVGDDDQSIYEFQGARLKNLVDFYQAYEEDLELILLQNNYRSTQVILDRSMAVIEQNKHRIIRELKGVEKKLEASNQEILRSIVQPRIIEYPNPHHEMAGIALKIEKLKQQGVPLSEIAVIYARHRQARDLMTLLEKKQIPFQSKRQVNILDLPLIRNLRSLLAYLHAEAKRPYGGEYLLFRLLHFRWLGVPVRELSKLSFYAHGLYKEKEAHWRDLIADEAALQKAGLQAQTVETLLNVSELLDELVGDYVELSLPILLERLINRSGLLKHTLEQKDQGWSLQVLKTFVAFVNQEADRQPRIHLGQLLETLDRMDANHLALPLSRLSYEQQEGVMLTTAHSAKGLEFQYVFLLDCTQDDWEPGKSGGRYRFPLPDTLTLSGEEDALEARRRLFYVAMTRAKEHLYISYSEQNLKGKYQQRTRFVDELIADSALTISKEFVDGRTMLQIDALRLSETETPRIAAPEPAAIKTLLEGLSLSITSFNSYLRCPLSFYYDFVLRVPALNSPAAAYGTAMHDALQRVFDKMLLHKENQFPDEETFIGFFKENMKRSRHFFPTKDFQLRMSNGERALRAYYRKHHQGWSTNVKTEQHLRQTEVGGVPVSGTLDRIDILPKDSVKIIDYKTGVPDEKKVRAASGKGANPHGGNYWRQLAFYKLLYQSAHPGSDVISGAISFLEPDARGQLVDFDIKFSRDQLLYVRELLQVTYRKIMDQDFYEGCGEPNCAWCNFVNDNVSVDSFMDEALEALDD